MRFLGVDIGGTKCAVCVGDAEAMVFARRQIPTGNGPEETLAALTQHARDLLKERGHIDAIGVVCGGPLDAQQGLVLSPPNLPGWDAVPVAAYFRERFGVPTFLQNDANAGALAEWRHGAGRGSRNMMFCTMGTGFGCGLILDGKLYDGTNGNAGELGHIRLTAGGPVGYGKAGSVEGYCGGGGIAGLARLRLDEHRARNGTSRLSELETLSANSVAEAAFQGDALALQVYAEVGAMLGRALSLSVDLLNLERIVVGSIFVRCEALIRPAMERVMQEECLPEALQVCSVHAAVLGERIGDVAALTLAQNAMERNA
jgi:glucokinase